MDFLITFSVCAIVLVISLFFFWIFVMTYLWQSENEDMYLELQSEFSERQNERNQRLIGLITCIRGGRTELWDEYKRLDAEDERLRAEERRQLVNARM